MNKNNSGGLWRRRQETKRPSRAKRLWSAVSPWFDKIILILGLLISWYGYYKTIPPLLENAALEKRLEAKEEELSELAIEARYRQSKIGLLNDTLLARESDLRIREAEIADQRAELAQLTATNRAATAAAQSVTSRYWSVSRAQLIGELENRIDRDTPDFQRKDVPGWIAGATLAQLYQSVTGKWNDSTLIISGALDELAELSHIDAEVRRVDLPRLRALLESRKASLKCKLPDFETFERIYNTRSADLRANGLPGLPADYVGDRREYSISLAAKSYLVSFLVEQDALCEADRSNYKIAAINLLRG